ncbi:GTP-binding nuclear protein gsp1/Ran [Binucleata daphniae]
MHSIGKYKIILIGDGGVGKTSFIKRYLDGSFTKQYIATIGAEVYFINLQLSNNCYITFEVWDTAGQEANSGLSDAYYLGAHGAVVFFDVTSRVTLKHVPDWIQKVKNIDVNNQVPITVVGNKADMSKDRKVDASRIRKYIPKECDYSDMSAKSNYNFDKPLLYMARQFTGNNNITFTTNINVAPADLVMDLEAQIQSNEIINEVKNATEAALPDDEDDCL